MSVGPSEDPQLEEAQPPEASCARIDSALTGPCRLSSEMIWATFCSFRRRGTEGVTANGVPDQIPYQYRVLPESAADGRVGSRTTMSERRRSPSGVGMVVT